MYIIIYAHTYIQTHVDTFEFIYVILCMYINYIYVHTYTRIIKNILKNERVCRDIYQNRKSTGTRWLWQQNEIPLPHNNRT